MATTTDPKALKTAQQPKPATTLTLPSDTEILVTRFFAAPPPLVFRSWTEPALLRRWYGCESQHVTACEIDLRVGGAFRWVLHDDHSGDHAFSGRYVAIEGPGHLAWDERYEAIAGSDHRVSLTFEPRDGGTMSSMRLLYPSKLARDGHLQSGMDRGLDAQNARVDALLAELIDPAATTTTKPDERSAS